MERGNGEHEKALYRRNLVEGYCREFRGSQISHMYGSMLLEIASLVNDEEFDDYTLHQLLTGLFASEIRQDCTNINTEHLSDNSVIAVCVMHNSEQLVGPYINHYKGIGVNNFVFIDNNSDDRSVEAAKALADDNLHVDVWKTDDRFDGIKAMSWKQRMFVHYGLNRWYLNLDIDEHVSYPNHEQYTLIDLVDSLTADDKKIAGGMLIDMYPDENILDVELNEQNDLPTKYAFFDSDTYVKISNDKYKHRIYGGPRTRLFNRHPSLQKFPLAHVDQSMLAANPHFWYPYSVNEFSDLLMGILHYKFLPGDLTKYREYVKSGVHWDNSSQYKSYVDGIENMGGANFFSSEHSLRYLGSISLSKVVTVDGERLIGGSNPLHDESIVRMQKYEQ